MAFYISRQRYYDDNRLAVEIAIDGIKYAGKDILPVKHAGENKNLVSPIDAVNIAIRIVEDWDLVFWDDSKAITLVNADDKGGRIYYDPHNKKDMAMLQQWAAKTLANMKKCCNCQKPLGKTAKTYEMDELPKQVGCSETCLAAVYRHFFNKEPPRVSSNRDKKIRIP